MTTSQSSSKTILIVGGGGFIGHALIEKLLLQPELSIIAVGRSPLPKFSLPESVRYYAGNISDADFIGPLLDSADTVVDLAYGSTPKTSFDDPVMDVIANLPASVSLQRMASERNIRRYLLVSSGGTVYGQPKYLPIDEQHPNNPISPYGISKLVTEKYAGFFFQMRGLPVVIARPSNAYGLGQYGANPQGFIGVAMYAILNNHCIDIYGARGTVRDYIYITDLADALALLVEQGVPGETYNIGSGIGSDNADVLAILQEVTGQDYHIKTTPHPFRPFDVSSNILECKKLHQLCGWLPETSLLSGIKTTWQHVLNLKTTD